ncbi:MAG: hypothetical protein D6768_19685 [Chloroflexi bacterium]|nr:MAG: hypothetical protein D6768_19685 [Chloroflexota bacterium]
MQHLQAQTAQLQVQMRRLQAQNAQLLARRQAAPPQPAATPAVQRGQPARPVTAAARTQLRVAVPVVQNLTRQLTRNPAVRLTARPLAQIDRIIIHHSGAAPTVGAAQIANFMVNQRKQAGIPFHYFVTANGTLQQTNDLTIITAHSSPALNLVSVGVCFAGNFNRVPPSPAQIEAGARLAAWLIQKLNLSARAVFGHKELVQTQSPGLQWDSGANWGAQLRQKIQAYLTGAA